MKHFPDFSTRTTKITVTEEDVNANVALAERRLRSLVRDAKRNAEDATKAKIDNLATDVTEIIHDWRDDDLDDIKNDTEPGKHTPLEKLASNKYGSFYDAIAGFGLKLNDDSSDSDGSAAKSAKQDKPQSIFVIDGKETEWHPSDATHELLAQFAHEKGKKVEVKTPDGLLLPYYQGSTSASDDDDDDNTDSSSSDAGAVIKVEIGGKLRRALTIKYGKNKTLALINQAKTRSFKSYDDADDSGEDIIWHQIIKQSTGIGRDGKEVFNYVLATKNPVTRPYRG